MIEKWHERTNSLGFKIIFTLVSLSFVLGGIGSGLVATDDSAVKVNGEGISQRTFTDAKNRQQNILYSQKGGEAWDLLDKPEYAREFNQSVLNSLINDELLRQYAKSLKLDVGVDQIKSEIVHDANFQQNGKFDNNLYQQTLRNAGLTTDGYAAIVREGMIFSQIEEGIINTSFDLPAQQEALAKLLFQKRDVRLATYSLADEAKNQTVSPEELQSFYDAHKKQLLTPETFTVEYLVLTPKDVEKRIQITDEQIATYYDKNKAQFVTKGEANLAHIQVANEAEANAIAQQLNNGADFATLAKEKSTDKLSAAQGGNLGWTKAGTFPQAFENAASQLQVGQVSQPIKIDNAYHIIKVIDRKAENIIPLAQVKDKITETIRKELLASEYSTVARDMANSAFENSGSLEAVAKVAGLEIHKTSAFTQANVPAELQHEAVEKALFESDLRQTGQNSDALEIGDAINPRTMFVRVSDFQAEREKTLEEAKTDVEAMVKREKAEKALLSNAEANLVALNEGKNNISFGETQTLVYAQAQAQQPVLAKTVFNMPKLADKATYQIARNVKGDVIIVALDKVSDGTLPEFKPLEPQFAEANRTILRNDLVKDLRERASIDVNTEFMEQLITPAQ
ncbi:SurA N-terminal domain-containing protein [Actinobacillus minor]|uniref:SurA N-terminal domain-containing protein n=1 Tax=Actinobacillus minor TaxID=51047 RepID=UPI0023F42E50|nr:SurA N-terminal domain-containing protein [Actinobacillus minor]MDD6910034.1 SurA N-terminal domain-containing protein [Actinobacillus minor]MDY4713317.1 SurA N-terminal domain-containing protein [Actinobacillus minor]